MNDHDKTQQSLIKELHELRQDYNSLKDLYDKDLYEWKQTEIRLSESEKRFKLMFENAPLSYQSLDKNACIIDVNPVWVKTLGYERDEVIGHCITEFLTPESTLLLNTRFQEFLTDGEIHNYQFDMVRKDSTILTVSYEGKIGYNELGSFKQTHCIFEDISERKQSENALRESEEKYRFMFDNNPQPNWIYDLETLAFLEVNDAAINHYGYSRNEFLSMTLKDIRPEEDIPTLLEDVRLTSKIYNNTGDWRHVKKNGEIIHVEIISHTVTYNQRDARHVLVHDITDRKLVEEALKQANDELENLHNNLNEAVYSYDYIHNQVINASISHQNVFGYSPAAFFNDSKLWYKIILPEDRPLVDDQLPFLATGKNISLEYRIVDPNGQIRWIEAKMNPTIDFHGKLTRIDGIASDITQRKQIEIELLESVINFRRSISESPVGIRIVSEDGNTVYTNKAFLDIYEFNCLEEFTSTPAKVRYTPESYTQHQERKKKREAGIEIYDYEISIICKNQAIRHIKVSRKEVLWNGTKHYQVINQNITKQRNAEEQLRKLSRAVEQSPDGICITNPDGIIEYVNPRTIELTGFTIEELIGNKTNIFSSGEKSREVYAKLWETIKSGNVWNGELHNKKKNGELYWESTTISPIFNKQGQITHFLSIKEDVTANKKILHELIHAKERAEESETFLRTFIENIPFEVWARDIKNIGILENNMFVDHFGSILGEKPKLKSKINQEIIDLWKSNNKRVLKGETIDEEYNTEINHQSKIYQQIAFPIYKKAEIIGIAGLNIDITERKQAEIALNKSEEELRNFASHLQSIREEEKVALAREIHDDLGQILIALKIDMGLLKKEAIKMNTFNGSDDSLDKFDNIVNLIDNTIKSARRIMNGLRPELLELHGFVDTTKEYLREFEERHNISCEFTSNINSLEINQQQSLALFRIFQESMNNIVKHANATLVKIQLQNFDHKLYLGISDNGIGFDKNNSGRVDSYGMIGMKERVILLGGKLDISSEEGRGTTIKVEMPNISEHK